jgi:hypothetical protein
MNKNLTPLNVDFHKFQPLLKPIFITESSFAYSFFEFKYNKDIGKYELKLLYYEGIRKFLKDAGFFKRYLSNKKSILIRKQGCFIEEVSVEQIKDAFQEYVYSIDKPYKFTYLSKKKPSEPEKEEQIEYNIPVEALQNTFLKQSHNIFNDRWLEHVDVDTTPLLKDTKKKANFVFRNCVVSVSKKDGIETNDLSTINEFVVWKNQLIDKDFNYVSDFKNNEFAKFLFNVTSGIDNRYKALCSAIGYLSHNYFDPSKGMAVLLYDEAITDPTSPMGGTGKGLIANAIKQFRRATKIDGKLIHDGNRFKFELVSPDTQVVWIDDPKKDFAFETLFSCLTDGWTVERKFLPQFFIQPEDSPKVLICSNVILNRKGTSNKRRQFVVELNDYYSKQFVSGNETPIEKEHGTLFKEDWLQAEWDSFYSFMLNNVLLFLKEGLVEYETKNVEANFLVQSTNEDFVEFMTEKNYKLDEWYDTKEAFDAFIKTYYGEDSKFKQRGFTNWLKLYAKSIKVEYDNSSSGGITKFIFISPQKQETT